MSALFARSVLGRWLLYEYLSTLVPCFPCTGWIVVPGMYMCGVVGYITCLLVCLGNFHPILRPGLVPFSMTCPQLYGVRKCSHFVCNICLHICLGVRMETRKSLQVIFPCLLGVLSMQLSRLEAHIGLEAKQNKNT